MRVWWRQSADAEVDGSPIGVRGGPFANIERNRSIGIARERWPLLQEVGRLAVYFTAQAGESAALKGDIQSVLDTWAGHAEEVVASNRR